MTLPLAAAPLSHPASTSMHHVPLQLLASASTPASTPTSWVAYVSHTSIFSPSFSPSSSCVAYVSFYASMLWRCKKKPNYPLHGFYLERNLSSGLYKVESPLLSP